MEQPIADDFDTAPAVAAPVASTPLQLTANRTSAKRGIILTADPGNLTNVVYVGDENVDATHYCAVVTVAVGPVLIPISDASKLWIYTTASSQKVGWASV